jgi:hypothetical protein
VLVLVVLLLLRCSATHRSATADARSTPASPPLLALHRTPKTARGSRQQAHM